MKLPGILAERHLTAAPGFANVSRSRRTALACGPDWRQLDTPNADWSNFLGGVSAASPTDIWAVGNSQDPLTGNDLNLAEHWNGSTWTIFSPPNPGIAGNDLTDVVAISSTDVWASGVAFDSASSFHAVAFNGTGNSWNQAGIPTTAGSSYFNQVAASSPTNVWFVGAQNNGGIGQALIVKYDGSTFSTINLLPGGASAASEITSVSVLSPSDVWLAGYLVMPAALPQTLIEHWDGNNWGLYSPNVPSVANVLLHIAAVSSSEALAVGFTLSGGHRAPIAAHYTPITGWALTPIPLILGTGDNVLGGLVETTATDAWAVGYWRQTPTAPRQSLVEHWDGASWSISSGADIVPTNNVLFSVAQPVAGDVWAVGYFSSAQGLARNLSENLSGLAAPTGVRGSAGSLSATVDWIPPCSDGGSPITAYVVTAYDGCTIAGSQTVTGAPPPAGVFFTGLTNGSAFTFRVAAVNALGTGPQSAPIPNARVVLGGFSSLYASACSTQQYFLTGSNGTTWTAIDPNYLSVTFQPTNDSYAVLSANVDLWTMNAGYNQDIGIMVTGGTTTHIYPTVIGQPEAWKESGGFAGNFSPNAAFVQAVVQVDSAETYAATLVWKANKPDAGTIAAGAGPIGSDFSPTRLTVFTPLVSWSSVYTKKSTRQYHLTGSNGATWQDIDATGLSVTFPAPDAGGLMLISGNVDLWTASAGYNQDIGVALNGAIYPTVVGRPEAWKESGGFAGTFSPNAAFVQLALGQGGGTTTYTAKLVWKANKSDPGTIFAGAGPIGGKFSPTTLTVILLPYTPRAEAVVSNSAQYSQVNSDGARWNAVPAGNLTIPLGIPNEASYLLTVNADLWTADAGYNQDIGIMFSGGVYGAGTLVAWKESGGLAGTFSPNAAFLSALIHLKPGNYQAWVVWKANRLAQVPNAIYIGAGGPLSGFSQISFAALFLGEP